MARKLSKQKLDALRAQQDEIAKLIKEGERAERDQQRAAELRREALTGRVVLNFLNGAAEGDATAASLWTLLDAAIKRPADRALFKNLSRDNAASA